MCAHIVYWLKGPHEKGITTADRCAAEVQDLTSTATTSLACPCLSLLAVKHRLSGAPLPFTSNVGTWCMIARAVSVQLAMHMHSTFVQASLALKI